MKPWDYYSTPKNHPWVNSEDIRKFKDTLPSGDDHRFIVSSWIWQRDEDTMSELYSLYGEFIDDMSREFGADRTVILDLDPYDNIIGCPENWESPGSKQYEEMYKFVKKELGIT